MSTVTLGDKTYRTGLLDPIDKLIALKKITPILGEVVPLMQQLRTTDASTAAGMEEAARAAMQDDTKRAVFMAALTSLSKITDDELRSLVGLCCSVVERQGGPEGAASAIWTPVYNVAVQRMQFSDMDMGTLIAVVITVLSENLGSFSDTPSGAPVADGTPAA